MPNAVPNESHIGERVMFIQRNVPYAGTGFTFGSIYTMVDYNPPMSRAWGRDPGTLYVAADDDGNENGWSPAFFATMPLCERIWAELGLPDA